MSDRRQLFEKNVKGRTGNVIRTLRILQKTANSKTNEYSNDEASQIMAAIDEEVEEVRRLFQGATPSVKDLFDFDRGDDAMPPLDDDVDEPTQASG